MKSLKSELFQIFQNLHIIKIFRYKKGKTDMFLFASSNKYSQINNIKKYLFKCVASSHGIECF